MFYGGRKKCNSLGVILINTGPHIQKTTDFTNSCEKMLVQGCGDHFLTVLKTVCTTVGKLVPPFAPLLFDVELGNICEI